MATILLRLHESQLEGTTFDLVYDDVTLVASGFVATVPDKASKPMVVTIVTPPNKTQTFSIPQGQLNRQTNFTPPNRLQGALVTTPQGDPGIDFGISSIAFQY